MARRYTRRKSCSRKWLKVKTAEVAKLADAPDLGSGGVTHRGSSPLFRTNNFAPTTTAVRSLQDSILSGSSKSKRRHLYIAIESIQLAANTPMMR